MYFRRRKGAKKDEALFMFGFRNLRRKGEKERGGA